MKKRKCDLQKTNKANNKNNNKTYNEVVVKKGKIIISVRMQQKKKKNGVELFFFLCFFVQFRIFSVDLPFKKKKTVEKRDSKNQFNS